MNKVPRGRKLILAFAGMTFTIPDPVEQEVFHKRSQYGLNKQSGKRKTKKEWD